MIVFVVHFVDFPGSVPNFRRVSGGGMLLDASPAATVDETYQRLAAYGEEGRRNYLFRNVTVDVLLPLSVVPFLYLVAVRARSRVSNQRFLGMLLLSPPFVYLLFDFVENATVLSVLASYPVRADFLAASLPYETLVKRWALLLALIVPMTLLGVSTVRDRFRKSRIQVTLP
jgi:hypothetical protein